MNSAAGQLVYYKPWIFFYIAQSIGLLVFVIGMAENIAFYLKGRAISLRNERNYWAMIKTFFAEVLLQKQLFNQSIVRWLMHIFIFWGFLALLSLSAMAVLLETVIPPASGLATYFTSGPGYNYYKALGDTGGLLIFIGAGIAFARRYFVKPEQVETIWTDTIALNSLIVLVITGFALEAMRLASVLPTPVSQYSFVANYLSGFFRGSGDLRIYMTSLWVIHSTLTALLIAYIPYSKLMHIFSAPVEIIVNASEDGLRGDLYGCR